MTIELARVEIKQKPWGSTNLLPWSDTSTDGKPVGELWFQRTDATAPDTALLLKLLFTTEPLSIQVHPDDAFAQSIGLANGKTEAWYILVGQTGRPDRPRPEAHAVLVPIAIGDRGRLDRRYGAMASRARG